MLKLALTGASLTALAATMLIVSPATASSVCYNQNSIAVSSAGTVCGDVDTRATNATTMKDPTQIKTNNVSVQGGAGGQGVGSLATASGTFGEAHIYGMAFYEASSSARTAIGDGFVSFTDLLNVGSSNVVLTFTSFLEGTFADGGNGQSMVRMYDLAGGGIC